MGTSRREFLATSGAASLAWVLEGRPGAAQERTADLILVNGKLATLHKERPFAEAVSIKAGRFLRVGSASEVMTDKGTATRIVDLKGHTAIPGLNDSHTHPIRGGLNYNLELRWDGVPSLSDAMALLKDRASKTPPPQWVRVVGGWSEFQFKERRMPTLAEINEVAPDTPVFVLHLYDRAWLNGAALRAVGYTKDTPNPPGGEIEHDKQGNPTGLLIARPNAAVLYATLAKGPKLGFDDQLNSSRRFMRELNRLGVTSVIDAGGGFQNYPDDYKVIEELAQRGQLTTRIAYHLFTQRPKGELDDFKRWSDMVKPGHGDDLFRLNGAGEMLVYSAADFEDFLEPRPDMPGTMEPDLTAVVTHLAKNRWPFRLHATYDETISRALAVFESVDREVPFAGLRWFIDHAETISPRNIERL
jgi:predicted amidohydrolase YtcJ